MVSLKTRVIVPISVLIVLALFVLRYYFTATNNNPADKIIFGGPIVTMEGSAPKYTKAVAIKGDKIIFVGSKKDALKYKNEQTELIDLKGKTMFPGFIDPHLHPAAIAVFYYSTNIRADEDWHIPGLKNTLVTSHDGYIEALKKAESELKDPNEWLVVGGYASYYHGKIDKSDLEQISASRPIILFQRSFHEAWLNSKAMEIMGFTEENCKGDLTRDFANGHFLEGACIETIWPKMIGILLYGDRWQKALQAGVEYLHKNGITTIMDPLAFDGFTKKEVEQFREIYGGKDSLLRTYMIAEPRVAFEKGGADAAVAYIDGLSKNDGPNIKYEKAVKGFVDGAFFAQLMRLKGGYTDGRQGVWITPPDELKEIVTVFWNKGYPLHIHINGDEGLDWGLETFAELKKVNPKSTSRVVFHHLGYAIPDQIKKMKELGIYASVQPYYIHALGDIYSTHGFGPERAAHISPTGAFVREGIITSLHSDFFMGPSSPLYLAWCAVNRIGVISGKVLGPEDRLTVYQALRTITIDAAYTLSLENEIGSIKPGKKADFTILAEDPLKIDPVKLKDIKILAKVFNGKYYDLNKN